MSRGHSDQKGQGKHLPLALDCDLPDARGESAAMSPTLSKWTRTNWARFLHLTTVRRTPH